MQWMLIFVLVPAASVSEELCPLQPLAEFPYSDVECQFYLGTTAYRAGVYEVAAAHWVQVLKSNDQSELGVETKKTALGTLAYLKFYGLGVREDKQGAVQDWTENAMNGDIASRRSLGFAYADEDFASRDDVLAAAWYMSVFLRHPDRDALDEGEKESFDLAVEGLAELEARITDEQRRRAEKLAEELL